MAGPTQAKQQRQGNAVTSDALIAQVDQYIEQQSNLDLLRFITCGSVDDGKSTLIGAHAL